MGLTGTCMECLGCLSSRLAESATWPVPTAHTRRLAPEQMARLSFTHNRREKHIQEMNKILFFPPHKTHSTARNAKNALWPSTCCYHSFLSTKTALNGFLSHTLAGGRAGCVSELWCKRVCIHTFAFVPGRVITETRVKLHGRVLNGLIFFSAVFWHLRL